MPRHQLSCSIKPIQINAYRKTGIRKTKTDALDAFWIADFLRIGRARPNHIPEPLSLQLRELSRFRFGLVDRIGDLIVLAGELVIQAEPILSGSFEGNLDGSVKGLEAFQEGVDA